ncbi:hypothetical protein K493DRAFT_304322 [Basidiobolus meristosporus CBS 931.73]|uniref:Calponin-homology (CH) domain-containing protein n=1 Tax=Basidiobolus meristosporus CBS 931.73 TaxID=1314790 RepID=A0A1Y1XZD7_9FUNG|nr:hypothetical protein K493DRAFT_304322 [Basidiobolus meristosporus CBS 931.73]|eukprot:ORX91127.1 hypothetical protein K493DRAFT_304322 [Basidiobolus meristosporus CBS 931.73]
MTTPLLDGWEQGGRRLYQELDFEAGWRVKPQPSVSMSQTTLRGSVSSFCLSTNPPLGTKTHCAPPKFSDKLLTLSSTYEEIQRKTFTKWINFQLALKEDHIASIETGFRDGERLLKLLEVLSKQPLPKVEDVSSPTQGRSNVETALLFLEKTLGEPLSCLNSKDIEEGNITHLLELIWQLILKFQIQQIADERPINPAETGFGHCTGDVENVQNAARMDTKDLLMRWVQSQLANYGEIGPRVEDFHESWKDGVAFSTLIHRHDPNSIAHPKLVRIRAEKGREEWEGILNEAFLIAHESMGIPLLLDAEDLLCVKLPDERSIMTYVSQFYTIFARKHKDLQSQTILVAAHTESSIDRAQKKHERHTEDPLVVGDRLISKAQQSLKALPAIPDLKTELGRLTLGDYWVTLTSSESVAAELAQDVRQFVSMAEKSTAEGDTCEEVYRSQVKEQSERVVAEYEELRRAISELSCACKDHQAIVDKIEEISVFEKAIDELTSDIHRLRAMRQADTPRRERSSLLSSVSHDLEELEHSIILIVEEMPTHCPAYLHSAQESLNCSLLSAKTLITEESLQLKQDKSTEDLLSRLDEATAKLEEGAASIAEVEANLLSCALDFGKYKTVLSEQKALLKSSFNSLKAMESELSALLSPSNFPGKTDACDIPSKLSTAESLVQKWQDRLNVLNNEIQRFEELFKYLQIEKLMQSKLVSIKADIDSWDEESAEHAMAQTGNGLRLLRKKFQDMAIIYAKAMDIQLAQERHAQLEESLKESELIYEQKRGELNNKGTPTRWQDTAKDIENVLERLRSTLSSRILAHGLSCTPRQHDELHQEIGQLEREISTFKDATWASFEMQTTERLGESSSGIRIIIENIHQVLLGSWIEVQESLERRKKEVRMISRGFEFGKLADKLEMKMSDIGLLAKKIVDQEELRNEAESQLLTFKQQIEHLSLEFGELFNSDDDVYAKRLAELEDTYEYTRNYLIESLKESNSNQWWCQAGAAKVIITGVEQVCDSVTTQFNELTTQSRVDSLLLKLKEGDLNLEQFEKKELDHLAYIKNSLDCLPDEERPEDMDRIVADFEDIQLRVSNLRRNLRNNSELLGILGEVLPMENGLKILNALLDDKNAEIVQLIREAKWSPALSDVSLLQAKYEALDQQLTDIKKKYIIGHSRSIATVIDLLQSSPHTSIAEKRTRILEERDRALAKYESLRSTMERGTLLILQSASVVEVFSMAKNLKASIDEVRDLLDSLVVYSESGNTTIESKLKLLEKGLEELGSQVRIIPEMEAFLAGGDIEKSSLEALQAAISQYEVLVQSRRSISAEFTQKRDLLHRDRIHDEYLELYHDLTVWIGETMHLLSTEDISDGVASLEAQLKDTLQINSDISERHVMLLALDTLRVEYEKYSKSPDSSTELQAMIHSGRELDILWDSLKELSASVTSRLQSKLMYLRFVVATQNLSSVLGGIHSEIESADPIMIANETVLNWREKLDEVEQETSSAFAAAREHCSPEHTDFLQRENAAAEAMLGRIKVDLAAFLASMKNSRLMAVYLDDAEDFRCALVSRHQEIASARNTFNVIKGESYPDDELQLEHFAQAYLDLELSLRGHTARYDHLREYYFTILAQSPDSADKIGQTQDSIESEWTSLSKMYNGMKKEAELLRLHVQWHQQLRVAEKTLSAVETRLERLLGVAEIDLHQEEKHIEQEQEKCRSGVDFIEHPHWSSLSKNLHPNLPSLKQRYSSIQARLAKLDLAPYELRNALGKEILGSICSQLDVLDRKIDTIKKNDDVSVDVEGELKKAESTLTKTIMERFKQFDGLFGTSSEVDEKLQSERKTVEVRAKSLQASLAQLKGKFERAQEFHELVNRIDNAMGSSLDLIEQNPEGREATHAALKELESSYNMLSQSIPLEIEKAISLAEGMDDWDIQERLEILPEQWEEMKILITTRLLELEDLMKRKSPRTGLSSVATGKRLPTRSRSMSPHITWQFKLTDSKSTWRPTSPVTGSYMRPTKASLSKMSAANQSFKWLRRPAGTAPPSLLAPSLSQIKKTLQACPDTQSPLPPIPTKMMSSSPNAYASDPKDPLDVEIGRVVNSCPISIKVIRANEKGHYWIGEIYPKLCYCRLLITKMVMVRVGGGWAELSRFLSEHYSFERRFIAISMEWASSQKEADRGSSATAADTPTLPANSGTTGPTDTELTPMGKTAQAKPAITTRLTAA